MGKIFELFLKKNLPLVFRYKISSNVIQTKKIFVASLQFLLIELVNDLKDCWSEGVITTKVIVNHELLNDIIACTVCGKF